MDKGDSGQGLLNFIFIFMYILIGIIWFAFYSFQGQDVLFNSRYDYWILITFQLISGCMLLGYVRLTGILWMMYFLVGCGMVTLPVLLQGYDFAINNIMPVEALIKTRFIVILIHITTYTAILMELFVTYKERVRKRLI